MVDCRWFDQPGQGVVTYITGLHSALMRLPAEERGNLELVYGVGDVASVSPALVPPGVELLQIGQHGFLWRLLRLPFLLRRERIDAAHFQYVCPLYSFGTRYIVTTHDLIFLRLPNLFPRSYRVLRQLFFGLSVKMADHVLTVSEESAADIRRYFHTTTPLTIIYNGFDARSRAELPQSATPGVEPGRFVLTVGRVEPRKNYPRLLGAYRRSGLRERGFTLVVVGFCDAGFASEAAALESEPGVVWRRYVADDELNWLYTHAAAFIYPSLAEGFGIPVLEALSAGLPCAISNTYPLADVRSVCRLFDPSDVDAIVDTLRVLVDAARSVQVPAFLRQKYDWTASARAYLAIVQQVAGASANPNTIAHAGTPA